MSDATAGKVLVTGIVVAVSMAIGNCHGAGETHTVTRTVVHTVKVPVDRPVVHVKTRTVVVHAGVKPACIAAVADLDEAVRLADKADAHLIALLDHIDDIKSALVSGDAVELSKQEGRLITVTEAFGTDLIPQQEARSRLTTDLDKCRSN